MGAEDRPNHIGHYFEELVVFQRICKDNNLDIPFLFHAGETLLDTGGSTEPENSNLFDAVALKSKRIGHGFSLLKHPRLIEKFKKTPDSPGICIELCPISNELLHLCRNIKEHPYPELLAAGIPCTVNSDNPSLFRQVPHLARFWQSSKLTDWSATPCLTNFTRLWLARPRFQYTAGNSLPFGA